MNEFVVGLDGSDQSRMALRWAAAAADAAGFGVRAVQSWSHPDLAIFPVTPDPVSAKEMDLQTQQAITAAVSETLGSSAAVTASVLRGPAAGAILQTVTPDSVLVLGSRGRGGFAGLLVGSVSQECVEYASCPVVVVRTDRVIGRGDEILVGMDESDGAQQALTWAQALASATGSTANHLVRQSTTNVAVVPAP
jgi:nucleotide-binding universal stress UspA family protein